MPLGPDPEYGLVADPEPTATLESCASSPDGCEHPPEPTSCTLGNAAITIAGIELLHRIRKGQFGLRRLGVQGQPAPEVWNAVLDA